MLKRMSVKNILRASLWSFTIVYLAASCSNFVKVSPDFDGVHPEVKEYYDYIYAVGSINGSVDESLYNVTVGFDDLEDSIIGKCRLTLFPLGNEIVLDRSYWNYASKMEKFMLVAHETFHCYFHKFHNNKLLEDGCPASIMYPETVSNVCNRRHFGRYVNEILNN